VSGVSIGAINSAIIAGNPPKHRLRQLQAFWDMITERKIWPFTPDGDIFRKARNAHSCLVTSVAGQPGFFSPRFPNPWMSLTGATTATSYYDSAPLRDTLLELVDFSLINEQRTRFSVGAVNVLSGNFVYFDNAKELIEPEHIMASGALPPALPMISGTAVSFPTRRCSICSIRTTSSTRWSSRSTCSAPGACCRATFRTC